MARIIKSGSVEESRPSAKGVLSLDDFAAEARQVVLDARKEAARIIAEARGQVDAAARAAAEKGYAEGLIRGQADGYQDGRKAGLAEARQELAARTAALAELAEKTVAELARARGELLHEGRCQVLDFALELAAKIVGRVAAEDGSAARENLRKALELADTAAAVCVKVNPGQLAELSQCMPALVEALRRSGDVRLVGDEAVSAGGVKVQTDCGEIDATIETQWANVVEALLGKSCGAGKMPASPEASQTGRYVSCADQQAAETGAKRPMETLGNGDRHRIGEKHADSEPVPISQAGVDGR